MTLCNSYSEAKRSLSNADRAAAGGWSKGEIAVPNYLEVEHHNAQLWINQVYQYFECGGPQAVFEQYVLGLRVAVHGDERI